MTFKINTKISIILLSLLFFVFSFLFIILFFQFPQKNEISQKINFKSDFNLIDHNGNNVSIKTFEGKSSAIFFGFTYCPDICPITISNLSYWLDQLDQPASKLTAYFISVDPERDTIEYIRDYIQNFSSKIVGISGQQNELDILLKAFDIYAKKVPFADNDYNIEHTSLIYLTDPQFNLIDTISYGEDEKTALKKIQKVLDYSTSKITIDSK